MSHFEAIIGTALLQIVLLQKFLKFPKSYGHLKVTIWRPLELSVTQYSTRIVVCPGRDFTIVFPTQYYGAI